MNIHLTKVKPVHSFDLWGVLVDQPILGPRVIEAYQNAMQGIIPAKNIDEAVRGYQGLLDGENWAIADKKNIVDTLEDPLWAAYSTGDASVNFDGALHQDALDMFTEFAVCNEAYIVLTTGEAPWVQSAVQQAVPHAANKMIGLYSGDKTKAETYENTFKQLLSQGLTMVTHTEDQLKGFKGLFESTKEIQEGVTLIDTVNTIYVERANLATREEVLSAGIKQYVTTLHDAVYETL